jgi:hypothetical protein
MGDSKRDGILGRRRLSIREGAVHVLLLFVLGLFVYFHLIKPDRTAVPMLTKGDGAEIFQNALEERGKMSKS